MDPEKLLSLEDWVTLFGVLRAAFPTAAPTRETVSVYHKYLKDLPIALLARAIDGIVKNRKFSSFPSVAEIREEALGFTSRDMETRALDAWAKAQTFLIAGAELCTDDVLNEAVRLTFGGWRGFGDSEHGNTYDQRRFVECYKMAATTILNPSRILEEWRETRVYLEEHKKEEG